MIAPRTPPELRAFQPELLPRLLEFVGYCAAVTDFGDGFHPGDLSHFLSNTLRGRDPRQHLFFTQDATGQVNALVWVQPPRFSGFQVIIHPSQRGGDLEAQLVEWAENAAVDLLQAENAASDEIATEVMDGDHARISALTRRGYQSEAQPSMIFTTRSLETPIPEPSFPEGFTIRSVAGEHEAPLVADVHSAAFKSNWTPEEYLKVMRSPAFDIQRERVVVAPDGRFAAFTVLWFDQVSRSALFEPVGCHPDFQRKGLTRALMYDAMHHMRARGMTTAVVLHLADNPASSGLYASVGFTPKHASTSYRKMIQVSQEKVEAAHGIVPNSN